MFVQQPGGALNVQLPQVGVVPQGAVLTNQVQQTVLNPAHTGSQLTIQQQQSPPPQQNLQLQQNNSLAQVFSQAVVCCYVHIIFIKHCVGLFFLMLWYLMCIICYLVVMLFSCMLCFVKLCNIITMVIDVAEQLATVLDLAYQLHNLCENLLSLYLSDIISVRTITHKITKTRSDWCRSSWWAEK